MKTEHKRGNTLLNLFQRLIVGLKACEPFKGRLEIFTTLPMSFYRLGGYRSLGTLKLAYRGICNG